MVALVAGWHNHLYAQNTAFSYQGRLDNNGSPASGLYDFRFKLYFDALGNTQVGEAFATNSIPATNGLFMTDVDFGACIFTGTNYWLEVDVRTNGATSYTVLTPLQPVTPTPYAIYANTASNLSGTLPASQLSGPLSSGQLGGTYSNAVTITNAADIFSGTFSGSFSGSGNGLADVWHTGGNLGTTAGTNFLGTTDYQPLELHVYSTRVLRLEPDSRGLSAGNLIGGYFSNAVMQPGSGGNVIAGGGYSGGANLIYSNSSGVFIGAGSVNSVGPNVNDSVIAGGYGNTLQSPDSAVGGGYYNSIQTNSSCGFIGAGLFNSVGPNAYNSVLAGGYGNTVQSANSAVGGGYYNSIQTNAPVSFIGGGNNNTIQPNAGGAVIGGGNNSVIQTNADHAVIAGGWQNVVQYWGYESVIGGGTYNAVGPFGQFTVIAGGHGNTNSAPHAFIGGGYENTIQANSDGSVIAGGESNGIQPNSYFSAIAGGYYNTIQAANQNAFIGGGNNNTIQANSPNAIIGGGINNTIQFNSQSATIGGGNNNTIQTNSQFATIGGGVANTIQTNNPNAFIGGGNNNTIQANAYGAIITGGNTSVIQTNADHSLIAGGWQNIVQYWGYESVIGGGAYNAVGPYGQFAVIAGGNGNTNSASYSSLGGGLKNMIQSNSAGSVISGGFYNTIQTNAPDSFIGSGLQNTIQPNANNSVISGGSLNSIGTNSASSVIAGGSQNVIQTSASSSVIGGGSLNTVQGVSGYGVIGGGFSNQVALLGATVPGGMNNSALGYDSFAAGTGAQAINDGSFVLADYEPANTNNFSSTTTNQLSGRFSGGVRFVTSGAGMTVDGQPVLVGSVAGGQLSGSYTNPVTFNNPADTFVGNGSGLTNVNAATLGGLPVSAYAQLNTNVTFNNTRVTGLLRSGSETGTSEAPSPAGLVVRRINSTSSAVNQLVAETDNLTLLRDGTAGGFQVFIPASVGNVTIACMGINSSGTPVCYYHAVANPVSAITVPIYTDAQNIVHFECTFGRTYDSGAHLTQVTLSRYGTDYFWSGNVISTYNQ